MNHEGHEERDLTNREEKQEILKLIRLLSNPVALGACVQRRVQTFVNVNNRFEGSTPVAIRGFLEVA